MQINFSSGIQGRRAILVAAIVLLDLVCHFALNGATPPASAAAGKGTVTVYLDNRQSKAFDGKEIALLARTSVTVEGAGASSRNFTGVTLYDLLAAAGVDLTGGQRPAALSTYLLVEAGDGYRVLFSGAEVHRFLGAGEVLLADSEDGEPVPATDGPYRLVVTGDKVHARWLKHVCAVHVFQVAAGTSSTK